MVFLRRVVSLFPTSKCPYQLVVEYRLDGVVNDQGTYNSIWRRTYYSRAVTPSITHFMPEVVIAGICSTCNEHQKNVLWFSLALRR